MANTSYLTRVVEPYLINWVASKVDAKLTKKNLVVGQSSDHKDVCFEFDGVSADEKIVVCASASRSYKTGQMLKLFRDAVVLNSINADSRIMVFVDANVKTAFINMYEGLVNLSTIRFSVCDNIPKEMICAINGIYKLSSEENCVKSGRKTLPRKRGSRSK